MSAPRVDLLTCHNYLRIGEETTHLLIFFILDQRLGGGGDPGRPGIIAFLVVIGFRCGGGGCSYYLFLKQQPLALECSHLQG